MNFEESKNITINLTSIGGREVTLDELVSEMVRNRRRKFFRTLFSLKTGESNSAYVFDAIGFKAAKADFSDSLSAIETNYEGTIMYDVIAGSNWVWRCKTEITWQSTFPIAFGRMQYRTVAVANENVDENRIHAMNGTLLEIRVVKNNLKPISHDKALKRDFELINN